MPGTIETIGAYDLPRDPRELGVRVGEWAAAVELAFPEEMSDQDRSAALNGVQQARREQVLAAVQEAGHLRLEKVNEGLTSLQAESAAAAGLGLHSDSDGSEREQGFGLVFPMRGRDRDYKGFGDMFTKYLPEGTSTTAKNRISRSFVDASILGLFQKDLTSLRAYGTTESGGITPVPEPSAEMFIYEGRDALSDTEKGYLESTLGNKTAAAFIAALDALSVAANSGHNTDPAILSAADCAVLLSDTQK